MTTRALSGCPIRQRGKRRIEFQVSAFAPATAQRAPGLVYALPRFVSFSAPGSTSCLSSTSNCKNLPTNQSRYIEQEVAERAETNPRKRSETAPQGPNPKYLFCPLNTLKFTKNTIQRAHMPFLRIYRRRRFVPLRVFSGPLLFVPFVIFCKKQLL